MTVMMVLGVSPSVAATQGGFAPQSHGAAPTVTPLLDVGMVLPNAPVALQSVLAATRVGTTLVVADFEGRKLVFYDASGRVLRSIEQNEKYGSEGFRTSTWIGRCAPGTLFVYDPLLSRIALLDASGNVERYWRAPPASMRLACSIHGILASLQLPQRQGQARALWSLEPAWAPLLMMDLNGNFTASIDSVDVGIGRPAGRMTSIALSNDRLFVGLGDGPDIAIFGMDGRRVGALRSKARAQKLTRAHYDSIITIQFGRRPGADSLLSAWRSAPMPDALPVFRAMHATPDGTVWLTLSSPAEPIMRLEVLGGDGGRRGLVTLPVRGNVLEVGDDHLIIEYRSSDGVEHVGLFSLGSRQATGRTP